MVSFQGNYVSFDPDSLPPYSIRDEQDGPQYNNLLGLIDFLNENNESYRDPNRSGSIFVADD